MQRLTRQPLPIAAVQPNLVLNDLDSNVTAHAEAILRTDSRVVVFPELSLTGYNLREWPRDSLSKDVAGR